jgi:hypothetical protein
MRHAREDVTAWTALVSAVRRSALARLDLLNGRAGGDRVPCPWEYLTVCDDSCRCVGAGTVTVDFLRDHYRRLPEALVKLARRSL